jgi:hypothetical protein
MTNLVILEGMVLGAPILFLVGNDPASFMLTRSLLVCIICLAVLLPMFVPNFTKTEDERSRRRVYSQFSKSRMGSNPAAWDPSVAFTRRNTHRHLQIETLRASSAHQSPATSHKTNIKHQEDYLS